MNSMIDGDDGDSLQSPYNTRTPHERCPECCEKVYSITEVEYCYTSDHEDEPTRFKEVCNDCLTSMKRNPEIIMM
jgi:hypothetical protein